MTVKDNRIQKYITTSTYGLDGIKLTDLAEFAESELAKIPEVSRSSAYIDVSHTDYDGTEVNIVYTRLETWDEMEKREADAKRWQDKKIADAKKLLGIK